MINELVQKFKINLEEDGKSPKTIESYVGDTSVFIEAVESKGVDFNEEMKGFYIIS
jgi:integrase/recombinase XerD